MPSAPLRAIGRLSSSSSPSLSGAASPDAGLGSDGPATPTSPTTAARPPSSSSAAGATPSSSRPGLLSRLSLPLPRSLRSRNRNVADFHVRCDEPHRKYGVGEQVRGAVVLAVVKPLRITHLVVALHGYVRVLATPAAVAKIPAAQPQAGGGSDRPRYHGSGFASLFQDEQVLSGEGRLEPGKYEFGFDLVFPGKGLPSSIDFERGTISYMVTATLTRPTSIGPTTSCDRKVVLVEKLDIGLLPPPRPRTIFLEPISKRTRRKKSMGLDKVGLERASAANPEISDLNSEASSVDPSISAEDFGRDSSADQRSNIPSDMRSEVSGESSRSVSTAISRAEFAQLSQVGTTLTSPKQQMVDENTITATIELLKGGCLPGDTVSVRVTVQHIKRVKSMTGVIVTLFRQGKIDTSPSSALFDETIAREDSRRAPKDEMYPRSRTGLGGLSLSSTSSTSMFRKDLDQNTAPLIIDPASLQASVTLSVKVPDDSFPTIRGVPGDMITFKYQVEIIVDLGGKMNHQYQGSQSASRYGAFGNSGSDPNSGSYGSRRGPNIADTSHLRREKGVISVSMETVVGTADSSRGRKQKVSPSSRTFQVTESDDEEVIRPELGYPDETNYGSPVNGHLPNGYFPASPQDQRYAGPLPLHQSLPEPPYTPLGGHASESAPSYIPAPQLPDSSNMTEKDRIRQAETRLLPSQPLDAGSSSSAAATTAAEPSAPPLPSHEEEQDDLYDGDDTPRLPENEGHNPIEAAVAAAIPSAPTGDELVPSEGPEDKQERERRRLIAEASAPPEVPDDIQWRNGGSSTQRGTALEAEPSAPVLDDDDHYHGYGVGAGPSGSGSRHDAEQLPAYER